MKTPKESKEERIRKIKSGKRWGIPELIHFFIVVLLFACCAALMVTMVLFALGLVPEMIPMKLFWACLVFLLIVLVSTPFVMYHYPANEGTGRLG